MVGLLLALSEGEAKPPFLAFGIGCFHFGARADTFKGSAADHVAAIRRWLEREGAVSHVDVRDPGLGWFTRRDLPFGLRNGGQPFPAIRGLNLSFDLRADRDVQNDFKRWGAPDELVDLHVSIHQASRVPIAFVVPDPPLPAPTLGVTLAWHTLRKLLADDNELIFDIRAPSPLHIDCFLVADPEPDDKGPVRESFEHEQFQPAPGYALAAFAYDPRAYADIHVASIALFRELDVPANVYYEATGAAQRLDAEWSEVEAIRDKLLNLERRRGPSGFIRRRFSGSSVMRELAIALADFDGDVQATRTECVEERTNLAEMPGTQFLLGEIDDELRTGFSFPTERIERLLDLFERRRLSATQNLAAIASALLAAAIGATAALWVSGDRAHAPSVVTVTSTQTTTTEQSTTPRPP